MIHQTTSPKRWRAALITLAAFGSCVAAPAPGSTQTPPAPPDVVVFYVNSPRGDQPLADFLAQELPRVSWQLRPSEAPSPSFTARLIQARKDAALTPKALLVVWLDPQQRHLHIYHPAHGAQTQAKLTSRQLSDPKSTHPRQLVLLLGPIIQAAQEAAAHEPSSPQPAPAHPSPTPTITAPAPKRRASRAQRPPQPSRLFEGAIGAGLTTYSPSLTARYLIQGRAELIVLDTLGLGLYADWMPKLRASDPLRSAHLSHYTLAAWMEHRWRKRRGDIFLGLAIGSEHTSGQIIAASSALEVQRWQAMALPQLGWRHALLPGWYIEANAQLRISFRPHQYNTTNDPSLSFERWRLAPALGLSTGVGLF